jgi:hypothetical protein
VRKALLLKLARPQKKARPLQALAEAGQKKKKGRPASGHQDVAGKEARLSGQQHQERRLQGHKAGGLRDHKRSKGKPGAWKEKEKPLKEKRRKAGRSRQSTRQDLILRHHGSRASGSRADARGVWRRCFSIFQVLKQQYRAHKRL